MYFDTDTLRTLVRLVHSPKTFSLRRLMVLDPLFALYGAVQTVNTIGEVIDDVRHPGHHDVDLGAPIYIVAAPRSGTTFLHRLMSRDPQFAAFKLYETLLPSIATSELIERMGRKNGLLARATRRISGALDQHYFGGWEGLHDTGLDQDEEDEGLWTLMAATPAFLLVLPFPDALSSLRFVDRLPEAKREKLAATYRSWLKRKLYRNPGKSLLMKSVLLPGRFELITKAAPNARFVHIVRHPYEALASMLSLFTMPWGVLAPEVHGDSDASRDLANLVIEYYRYLHEAERRSLEAGDGRFMSIVYTDLVADPMARVREIYAKLDLAWSDEVEAAFREELERKDEFRSKHVYTLEQYGLTPAYVDERLGDVMDYYGFERATAKARPIAKAPTAKRAPAPVRTTRDLAALGG